MTLRLAGIAGLALVAVVAAVVIFLAFTGGSTQAPASPDAIGGRTPTPPAASPTPLPATWRDGLRLPQSAAPELLSCRDANHDERLDAADGEALAGVDIALEPGKACADPARHADFFEGTASDPAAYTCEGGRRPLLIVAVASAGSDLLMPREGESMGLLDIVNELQARATAAGISSEPVLATSAIFGAVMPQTAMERWIERDLAQRLDAMPCLRAAVIGHSHGGVTVTSVTAALDSRYPARIFGVLLDRTTALYDRPASEMPERTRLLNIFQLNEGWHGVAIEQPNVTNVDASHETAPVAPSDGGGGPALVSHKTLDDAPVVQARVVDEVMSWAAP